jgi:hypothetical protein
MVDAREVVQLRSQPKEELFKLAAVTNLFQDGTAKVKFYGEEVASEKGYCYLSSYNPSDNDVVLMMPFAGTYIIAGKIQDSAVTPPGYITLENLNQVLQDYVTDQSLATMLQGYATQSQLNGFALSSHSHSTLQNSNGATAGLLLYMNGTPCFIPSGTMNLGGSGSGNSGRWKEIYAQTAVINTSDERQKNTINPIDSKYLELFKRLKPVTYKFNDGTNDRLHIGFISQDVEKAIEETNMNSKDFAGFIKTPLEDKDGNVNDYDYGLRYAEFEALNTYVIQLLLQKVEYLENKISGGDHSG